jgi:hypothetical protein
MIQSFNGLTLEITGAADKLARQAAGVHPNPRLGEFFRWFLANLEIVMLLPILLFADGAISSTER